MGDWTNLFQTSSPSMAFLLLWIMALRPFAKGDSFSAILGITAITLFVGHFPQKIKNGACTQIREYENDVFSQNTFLKYIYIL